MGNESPQGDATCKVNYYLQDDEYSYSKITFKEDTPPIDMNDGYVQDISASQGSVNIENLVEGQKYYFTIFTDKSESESFPYIVGPVITDWVNAELPSPMIIGELTKPYKFENFTEIEHITSAETHRLGFLYTKYNGTGNAWLFDDIIPSGSTVRPFWLFGNQNRGIYIDYRYVDTSHLVICPYFMVYYRNELLVERQLENIASAPVYGNNIIYAGKNDITKKGSMIVLFSSGQYDRIYPMLLNDTKLYYFITNRPNPADYEWYINQINGTGFTWKDLARNSGSGYNKYPFSDYSQWRSDNGSTGSFDITANSDAYVFQTEKSRIDIVTTDYVTYSAVLNPTHPFEREYYDSFSTYGYYTVGKCRYNSKYQYVIQGMTNEVNGYPYTTTGTLEDVLTYLVNHCRNVSIYVNGDCWSEVWGE